MWEFNREIHSPELLKSMSFLFLNAGREIKTTLENIMAYQTNFDFEKAQNKVHKSQYHQTEIEIQERKVSFENRLINVA